MIITVKPELHYKANMCKYVCVLLCVFVTVCTVASLCVRSYLVALDQDPLHLFEQVLQVPAA